MKMNCPPISTCILRRLAQSRRAESCGVHRQHCRLSICSYFGWVWQILSKAIQYQACLPVQPGRKPNTQPTSHAEQQREVKLKISKTYNVKSSNKLKKKELKGYSGALICRYVSFALICRYVSFAHVINSFSIICIILIAWSVGFTLFPLWATRTTSWFSIMAAHQL